MAHSNIKERRAAVKKLLDKNSNIPSSVRSDLAKQYGCTPGTIYADVAYFAHLGTSGTYHISLKKKRLIRNRAKGICQYCGTVNPRNHVVDHVKPYIQGGKANMSNLVFACASCNVKLRNKTEVEKRRLLLSDKRLDEIHSAYMMQVRQHESPNTGYWGAILPTLNK